MWRRYLISVPSSVRTGGIICGDEQMSKKTCKIRMKWVVDYTFPGFFPLMIAQYREYGHFPTAFYLFSTRHHKRLNKTTQLNDTSLFY
jgi:hypothetical protein